MAWGKAVDGTARELLTDPEDAPDDDGEKSALETAMEFLVEILKDGSAPSKYVESEAKEAGISQRTVRRASEVLRVKKRKMNDAWYWLKPNLATQLGQLDQPSNVGQVGQVEQIEPRDDDPF